MARLAKKESEWKGKLGFSSRSTKAEVRAKCKQTETANRSRVETMSEPVPSTSSASGQSESVSSVRSESSWRPRLPTRRGYSMA